MISNESPSIELEGAKILLSSQRPAQAEAILRALLAADPGCDDIAFRLGAALLMQGRYPEAWPLWDRRPSRVRGGIAGPTAREWRGEPLTGRTLVVLGEQGLGDEIMLARFIRPVRERYRPSRVIFACQQPNVPAMHDAGVDEVLPRIGGLTLPSDISWAMLGSLPRWLGTTLATIPPPYAPRVPISSGGGIGFVGQGQRAAPNNAWRSLPAGTTIRGARPVEPGADMLESFERVAKLDLLITVDTAWAHIAGSLGKPVWVLLPTYGYDWRWLQGRPTNPWYPSARVFKQASPGDWSAVLAQVEAELKT